MLITESLTAIDEFNKDCSHDRYKEIFEMTNRNGDDLKSIEINEIEKFFSNPDVMKNCRVEGRLEDTFSVFNVAYRKPEDDIDRMLIVHSDKDVKFFFYDSLETFINKFSFSDGRKGYDEYSFRLLKICKAISGERTTP